MKKILILSFLSGLLLCGCGQRGPLYLPVAEKPAVVAETK